VRRKKILGRAVLSHGDDAMQKSLASEGCNSQDRALAVRARSAKGERPLVGWR
jgi:hypothetical protein